MIFKIKLCDKIFRISSLHSTAYTFCEDYLTDECVNFDVIISQNDIEYEREKSKSEYIKEGKPVCKFSDDYLETLAIYRKIVEILLDEDVLLFHGSVVAVDGQGYLFTAKSGTGKSTHTRLWRQYFGDRAVMINDDKPLIKITDEGVIVYGTPWNGKHRIGKNASVKLKSICILNRGDENRIVKISPSEAYDMLVQQSHRPKDPLKLVKTLRIIDKLSEKTQFYKLWCNMDISAVKTAYDGMKG